MVVVGPVILEWRYICLQRVFEYCAARYLQPGLQVICDKSSGLVPIEIDPGMPIKGRRACDWDRDAPEHKMCVFVLLWIITTAHLWGKKKVAAASPVDMECLVPCKYRRPLNAFPIDGSGPRLPEFVPFFVGQRSKGTF